MIHKVEIELGGRTLTLETGKVAKQAGGAVWVRCGDSVVLATATAAPEPEEPPTAESSARSGATGG